MKNHALRALAICSAALLLVLAALPASAAERHSVVHGDQRLEIIDREGLAIWQGDIILGLGDAQIENQADFYNKLWATGSAGVEIPLRVLKGTQVQQFVVKSRARETYLRSTPVY